MIRKYATISNNIVVSIDNLDDNQVADKAATVQLLIDIEDLIPQPQIGWILVGNKLELNTASMSDDDLDSYQQTAQRLFGMKLLPFAVDQIGARNLKLAREATPVDIATLATQMASIKLLLEGGALKTARTLCLTIKPMFPLHEDILEEVTNEITNFLVLNNWN